MNVCKDKQLGSCVYCGKRKLSLLEGLSEEELALLNNDRIIVKFRKGETIYKEYTKPIGLYCLNEGKVKLVKYSDNGNEVIIGLKKPVDFIDLETLLANEKYNHTAIALEDTAVCIITEENFRKVLSENCVFANKLLKNISQSLLDYNEWFVNITQKQIHARIAKTLLKLKEFYGLSDDDFLNVSLKRSDIAALSCITTANVIRTISAFEKENIIECDKKRIKILNHKKLEEISQY